MKNRSVAFTSILAINFLIYGFNTLFGSLLPPYFTARFSPTVSGLLLSFGPLVAIFSPMVWGVLSDRAQNKNNVLVLAVLGAGLFFFCIGQTLSLPLLAVFLIATMFFMAPFGGLVDLLTLNACEQIEKPYGPCRVLGTLGFGMVALFGDLLMTRGDHLLFILAVLVAVLSMLSLKLMPQHTAPTASKRGTKGAARNFFRNKTLVILTVIVAAAQFTWAYYSNFCAQYLTDTMHASDGIWGTFVLVTVLSEIPFFFFFNRIFKRFRIGTLVWVSCVMMALRWVSFSWVTSIPVLLGISCITGTFVTILTYCATLYIKEHIHPGHQATTLNLLYALGMGLAKTLAALLGGVMTEYLHFGASILLCAGLMLLMVLLYVVNRKTLAGSSAQAHKEIV